jgi:predicted porin
MKMLLALSILTLVMAGAAVAGNTEWTFYGVAHASLNSLSDGNSHQLGLTSNTSRFGLKGTSPVNDSFTAFWQLESVLDMVGNTGSDGTEIGTRNTFVGVKNETTGKFILGRHDTPFKTLGRQVEMFPDQLGDFRTMTQGWDNRQSEIAAWVSPDWDGFSIFAAYQFNLVDLLSAGNAELEDQTSASVMGTYTTDHFMVGAAYQGFSEGYDSWDGDHVGDGPTAMRLAGKYMAERFELAGLYQTMTAKFEDDGSFEFDDQNRSVMGLSGTYHATDQWNLKGAVFVYNDDTDAVDEEPYEGYEALDESDTRATMIVVGVERVFNENVLVYAQMATVNNHDGLLESDGDHVSLGGNDSGFGMEVAGSYDYDYWEDGNWQDPAGFSVGTVISW